MRSREQNSLEIGETFDRDLVSAQGKVVLRAGQPVSPRLVKQLSDGGTREVFLAARPADTSPYSAKQLAQLDELFEQTPEVVEELTDRLQRGERVNRQRLDESVDHGFASIAIDPAAVLSRAISDQADNANENRHAVRNQRLSTMAMVAARELEFGEEECKSIGRAGLLCDIGLESQETDSILPERDPAAWTNFYSHPLRSAELLQEGMPGVNQLELIIVSQSHEQCDGSGFPRGLQKHHLHPLSRLLNLIDTFLQLTDPDLEHRLTPSDALAYLVLHSLYGAFDRECIRGLVKAAAIYPIGSKVLLEDDREATVVRSSGENYLEPVIQLPGSTELVDLRGARLKIVAPRCHEHHRRLNKSEMHRSLWQRAG